MKTPRQTWVGLPKLIRFMMLNISIGIAIGWFVALGFLWSNVQGFGDLYANADDKFLLLVLLAGSFGTIFGLGYLMTALLLMPTGKDWFDRM